MHILVIHSAQPKVGDCPITGQETYYGEGPQLVLEYGDGTCCPVSMEGAQKYAPLDAAAYEVMRSEYEKLSVQADLAADRKDRDTLKELDRLAVGEILPECLHELPSVAVEQTICATDFPCVACGEYFGANLANFIAKFHDGPSGDLCPKCAESLAPSAAWRQFEAIEHETKRQTEEGIRELEGAVADIEHIPGMVGTGRLPRTYYATEPALLPEGCPA